VNSSNFRSEEIESKLCDLVMWECMEATHVDPKFTLRTMELRDLSVLLKNVEEPDEFGRRSPRIDEFVVIKMVKVEMMYRTGRLKGDWTFLRLGDRINLRYSMISNEVVNNFHQLESVGWASA
jgi:hypothetical protein